MRLLNKLRRRVALAALSKSSHAGLIRASEKRVLKAFRSAAGEVPAYKATLEQGKLDVSAIKKIEDFRRLCPVLDKDNTFGTYSLSDLCRPGVLDDVAGVLTSSGHGSRFAFGLTTRQQAKSSEDMVDLGLEFAFQVDTKRTLLINCLPMGVRITSKVVTIADVSVREDMALALAQNFGPYYDQIIFLTDPLFCKRLTDVARLRNMSWSGITVNVVIGEETFGEHFRDYTAECFDIDLSNRQTGSVLSSMGIGELGLNLFYETHETVQLRRAAIKNEAIWRLLFAEQRPNSQPPMLFVYNPIRTYVETLDRDVFGYGDLTLSLNDTDNPVPLLRYNTGDRARAIAPDLLDEVLAKIGPRDADAPPLPIIAIAGRRKDSVLNGLNLLDFKDALYKDKTVAEQISGAFRLEPASAGVRLNIQLRVDAAQDDNLSERMKPHLPLGPDMVQVKLWPYESFPFGMSLDYERKFNYVSESA